LHIRGEAKHRCAMPMIQKIVANALRIVGQVSML